MKAISFLLCIVLFFGLNLNSQTLWDLEIMLQGDAKQLITTKDGNYLVSVCTFPYYQGPSYLIKYDQSGNCIRVDTIPFSSFTFNQAPDGNIFILSGFNVCKISPNGSVLWNKRNERPKNNLIPLDNGGFIANSQHIYHFCKYDANGEMFEEGRYLYSASFAKIISGNRLLIGNRAIIDLYTYNSIASKQNQSGEIFSFSFDSTKIMIATITSDMNGNPYSNTKFMLFDINTLDSLFYKDVVDLVFWQSQMIYNARPTPDNGYLFFGKAQEGGPYEFPIIIKTDSMGYYEWYKNYNFGTESEIIEVVNALDGPGYVILAKNYYSKFLVRVGDRGQVLNIDSALTDRRNNIFKLFPNPAYSEINIAFNSPTSGEYFIYDLLGNLKIQGFIKNAVTETLPINFLERGVYFFKFIGTDNLEKRGVFIKEFNNIR